MEDSAAATVKMRREKICPLRSSKYVEKIRKFRLTARSINSIHISITTIFLRLKKIPQTPSKKSNREQCKKEIQCIKQTTVFG